MHLQGFSCRVNSKAFLNLSRLNNVMMLEDNSKNNNKFFNTTTFYLAFVMLVASLVALYRVTGTLYPNL